MDRGVCEATRVSDALQQAIGIVGELPLGVGVGVEAGGVGEALRDKPVGGVVAKVQEPGRRAVGETDAREQAIGIVVEVVNAPDRVHDLRDDTDGFVPAECDGVGVEVADGQEPTAHDSRSVSR